MQQKLELLINNVMHLLEERELSKATLSTYRTRYFHLIEVYFTDHGTDLYSERMLNSCLSHYRSKFENGAIGKAHFLQMERCIRYLREYYHNKSVTFHLNGSSKKYLPTNECMQLVELITNNSGYNYGTRKRIHCCMREFFCYLEANSLSYKNLTDDIIMDFLPMAHNRHKCSMWDVLCALRLISEYLNANGLADIQIDFRYLLPKKASVRLIPAFTPDEVRQMLRHINRKNDNGTRDMAIILLACYTGMRGADIIHLTLKDIDWKNSSISFVQSKTGNRMSQPISGQIMNLLADYILNFRPKVQTEIVFITRKAPFRPLSDTSALDTITQRLCRKAGIPKRERQSFHSFRRACATWLSSSGVPLTTITQILGHADLLSDRHYLTYDMEQIAQCAIGFDGIGIQGGVYHGIL